MQPITIQFAVSEAIWISTDNNIIQIDLPADRTRDLPSKLVYLGDVWVSRGRFAELFLTTFIKWTIKLVLT